MNTKRSEQGQQKQQEDENSQIANLIGKAGTSYKLYSTPRKGKNFKSPKIPTVNSWALLMLAELPFCGQQYQTKLMLPHKLTACSEFSP